MMVHESTEDYLKQILMLLEKKGHARSVDIAIGRNVSKPTVSITLNECRILSGKGNGYCHWVSISRIQAYTSIPYT